MHKLIISHLAEEVWKTNFGIVDLIAKGEVLMAILTHKLCSRPGVDVFL